MRRSITRATRAELVAEMARIQAEHNRHGRRCYPEGSSGSWLVYWLREVVPTYAKPTTIANYEGALRRDILPVLGDLPLGHISQADVERMLALIESESVQAQALKTLRAGLEVAVRRRLVERNAATLVVLARRAPVTAYVDDKWDARLIEPPTKGERRTAIEAGDLAALLGQIDGDRLRARWLLGLLGARRAEVLGLVWEDLSPTGVLRFSRNRIRDTYSHGCGDELTCNRSPGLCPQRRCMPSVVGLKTASSSRELPLGPQMVEALEAHRCQQAEDRAASSDSWNAAHAWMFTTPNGRPLTHSADYRLWCRLVARAEVSRHYKPHELRHTAASLLGAMEVSEPTLMALMGWSTRRMVDNYRHPLGSALRQALRQMEADLRPRASGSVTNP